MSEFRDVANTGSKIGRSVELDKGKAGTIGCDDTGNSIAIWIGGVKVDVELVRHSADWR